jgi:polyphosphate kinase
MSRNLSRRVETLVPMINPTVRDQVLQQVLLANLLDTEQSWLLDGETGEYERIELEGEEDGDGNGKPGFNCHDYFMTNPSLSGRGGALKESRVPKLTLRRGAA